MAKSKKKVDGNRFDELRRCDGNTRRLSTRGLHLNGLRGSALAHPRQDQENSGDDWTDARIVGTGQLFWDRQHSRFSRRECRKGSFFAEYVVFLHHESTAVASRDLSQPV